MSDPTFAQAERRSFVFPVLMAVVLLAAAAGLAVHFFPSTSVNIALIHADLLPTHTVFPSNSIVVGPPPSQDVLYVVPTIRIENRLRVPIYLDNFTLTFTDSTGAVLTVKAFTRPDLQNAQTSFPALKPLSPSPLLRETIIEPGNFAEGQIVLSFPFTTDQWNARKSAILKVDIYHQNPLYLDLPKP